MNKGTTRLLVVLISISIIVVTIAFFYYKGVNSAEDSRVSEARAMFAKYSRLVEEKKYPLVFIILDELEALYKTTAGYQDSFELGLVHNNRTATYLLMALYDNQDEKVELLVKAGQSALTGISIYEKWLATYGSLTKEEIRSRIEPDFNTSEKVLSKRVEDMVLAQLEVRRRLSVSYTNLGIVQRHQLKLEDAVASQKKALQLWPDNHTAKNNLNVLFGEQPKKRSVINQLFPKPKNKPSIIQSEEQSSVEPVR